MDYHVGRYNALHNYYYYVTNAVYATLKLSFFFFLMEHAAILAPCGKNPDPTVSVFTALVSALLER